MHTDKTTQKRAVPSREFTEVIIGYLYKVWNELGYGHRERYYQKAFATLLSEAEITFEREKSFPVGFRGAIIGRQQLDFIVSDALIVELKVGRSLSPQFLAQVLAYLKISHCSLALIALFAPDGVHIKRVIDSSSASVSSAKIGASVAR